MQPNTVFKSLLDYLESLSVEYCLLGATDDYPNIVGDIDIAISRDSFSRIDIIIQSFCVKNQLLLAQKLMHESSACFYVLSFLNKQDGSFTYIEVDFCSDYKRFGRLYITAERLLTNREFVEEKNYWKLNNTYSFIYYFIKKTDKKSLNQFQFDQLLKCWKSKSFEIVNELTIYFSKHTLQVISEGFRTENLNSINNCLPAIRNDLRSRIPMLLKDRMLDKFRILKRAISPTGLMICVLGRDGSGKTTFSNHLIQSLHSCFRKTNQYHLYPGWLFNDKKNSDYSVQPHSNNARNPFLSFFKLNLFFLEFFCGYWFKIYPKKITSTLLLFDRYFIDILIDPLRYRNSKNQNLIKFFHALIPKPDVWIILDVDSNVLMNRKSELSYELSETLRGRYLQMKEYLPSSIIINTEMELQESVNEATAFVLQKMSNKIFKK